MPYILAIESATKICSVALFNNSTLVGFKEEKGDYSHAENLAQFAADLLEENNLTAQDLKAVAVSKGPGSYTGLRIGVSFAKGLCYSLNIPLIAIDTLKGIAYSLHNKINDNAIICAMIDARRMEVYTALFSTKMETINQVEAVVVNDSSFDDELNKSKVFFIGDGANKCADIIQHDNAVFVKENPTSATHFGHLALQKYENKEFEDVAYFEPYYLKDFIALKGKKLV